MKNDMNIHDLTENENLLNNEEGQTFLEFVLLLMMIMFMSFGYMKIINTGIGKYWTSMANTLLIDVPGSKKLKLR